LAQIRLAGPSAREVTHLPIQNRISKRTTLIDCRNHSKAAK